MPAGSLKPRGFSLFGRIKKNYSCYLFMAPFAVIFLIFTLIPVVTAIYYSLTSFNVLEAPIFKGWANYEKLFVKDELFLGAIKNTLVVAAIVGPAGYILSLLFAWFINDLPSKLRAVMTLLFYAPSLANIFVIWKVIFNGDDYGLLNSYLSKFGIIYEPMRWLQDEKYIMGSVIVVLLWASLGAGFLSFIAGFQTIDKTLYEAGAVDGIKNRFQEMWFITLPAIKPQLLFGAIMSIASSFGVGDAITALVGFPSPNYSVHTLVHHIQDHGFIRYEMGYACAIAVILFIIMVGFNKIVQSFINRVGS